MALIACGGEPPAGPDAGNTVVPDAGNTGGDTTPPRVFSTTPYPDTVDVDVNIPILIEFSEAMDIGSVTVSASPGVSFAAPTWAFEDTVATYTPVDPFSHDTAYSITVNGKDKAGNAMTAMTFQFTTGAMPDTNPPTISSTTPADGAMNVATTTHLSVTFSKAMDIGTVSVSSTPAYDFGPPTWDAENVTATFDMPAAELAAATTYEVTIVGQDTGARDLAGSSTITFTTAAPPDSIPPTVINKSPADGATGVPINTSLSLTFSEPMNEASVEAAFSASPAVTCTFLWDSTSTLMTCDPTADLSYGTSYTVTLGTGAQDANGNALAAAHSFGFTTAMAPDTTAPTITAVTPTHQSVGAARNTNISVTFSEPMDKASAQAAFAITSPVGFSGGVFSWDAAGTTMTYNPPADFGYGIYVSWQLSTTAEDLAGNSLASNYARSFRIIRSSTINIYSSASLDGVVSDVNQVSASGDPAAVGDLGVFSTNIAYRGFLTFDLGSLPSTLTKITDATLRVYQSSMAGTPYGSGSSNLGSLRAESVNYGLSLTTAAYSTPTLTFLGFPLAYTVSTSSLNTSKYATVTNKVVDDWNNRASRGSRSQFRLRWSLRDKTLDGASDQVSIYMGENTSLTYKPRLSVTYEYP